MNLEKLIKCIDEQDKYICFYDGVIINEKSDYSIYLADNEIIKFSDLNYQCITIYEIIKKDDIGDNIIELAKTLNKAKKEFNKLMNEDDIVEVLVNANIDDYIVSEETIERYCSLKLISEIIDDLQILKLKKIFPKKQ